MTGADWIPPGPSSKPLGLDPSKPEGQQRYVAKMSKNPKEDKSTYFLDVEMQALAKLFAEEFNKRKPPKVSMRLQSGSAER